MGYAEDGAQRDIDSGNWQDIGQGEHHNVAARTSIGEITATPVSSGDPAAPSTALTSTTAALSTGISQSIQTPIHLRSEQLLSACLTHPSLSRHPKIQAKDNSALAMS